MQTITAEQLNQMNDKGVLLVNTLPSDHFDATRIPGAINLPAHEADFVESVEQRAGGKGATVVVYCKDAACDSSSNAAKKLEEAGFKDVYDFEVGYDGWRAREEQDAQAASASR